MRTELSLLRGLAAIAAGVLCAAAPGASAQISVPDDFTVLQDAVDAAAPGETILLGLGEHAAIVVDKPLTIVGRDAPGGGRPSIAAPGIPMTPDNSQRAPVLLNGPGAGEVRLVNLELTGLTSGLALFTSNAPAIAGGGFDELQVVSCIVEAPRWIEPFGGGLPEAGIDVDVPFLFVANSLVIGGYPVDDFPFVIPDSTGAPGIVSTGDVAVVDSSIRGGNARDMVFTLSQGPVPEDCDFPTAATGFGGAALRIDGDLYAASSQLAAGEGAQVFGNSPAVGTWLICKVSGSPALEVGGAVTELPESTLTAGPFAYANSLWELNWDAPVAGSVLVFGFDVASPLPVGAQGLLFADPSTLRLVPQPGAGPQTLSLPVRPIPGAEGLSIVVQRWSAAEGLGEPLVSTYLSF